MKISIVAVGRLKKGPEVGLFARYRQRVERSGKAVGIGPLSVIEIAEAQGETSVVRCDSEAQKILDSSRKADLRIALDENGKSLTSRAFGQLIADARDDGCQTMAFLIGGADGHGSSVKENSIMELSLSKLTLPHGLARIFLTEQIYRAITIASGHPYHRD